MASSQLDKLDLIFKREKMSISATDIVVPSFLDLKWESVGRFKVFPIFNLFLTLCGVVRIIFRGIENKSSGREHGVFEPQSQFLNNIHEYLHNRFLDIGNNTRIIIP